MTKPTRRTQCGYVCKRCGAPAPMGVGYTSFAPGALAASRGLYSCACGYSLNPAAGDYTIATRGHNGAPVVIAQVRRVQL